ncbi:MAG: UbiA family prenyltransferase [Candidatus Thermoplasmatota archaeon]|nr:UbiA family prenyltransferase [Candidatus Thermoplasmatota archaeon]
MGILRDWLDLFRAGNCITGFVGVFLGAILTLEKFPTDENLEITSLLALSVYSFMASWNALNDYLDLEIDKVNRPSRPLPSGRIGKSVALSGIILACIISFGSLFLAAQIANGMTDNFADWYPTIIIWFLALALLVNYEDDRVLLGLKNKGLPGNLAISISVGLVVLFGAAGLFDPLNERALSLFVIGTLYNLSREIIKDVEDMDGDKGRKTYAMRVGADKARLTSWLILLITLVALLIPFALGIFELLHIIFLSPGLFTLMNVKKHIYLAEDTAASRLIKISMTLTMVGLIIAALI